MLEDYIGSLFSFKAPRDTTTLLDTEHASNKIEKIALKFKDNLIMASLSPTCHFTFHLKVTRNRRQILRVLVLYAPYNTTHYMS
ncbi:hypothetical protein F5Y07DRAFT_274171 [Xylaria sp. FL0933]|nr:hypothetical protein F5Y07DRAFT_274171 [Xylaria sp. FL0933]